MELKDAVVLITGGAIRLGRAHGLHLAGKGAHIAFAYLPGEPWQETKKEIEALGVRCTATELDVRNLDGVRQWMAQTDKEFGRIDVLINNASPWVMRPFLEVTEAEYDLCNDVTVKAAFFCTQAVAPFMLRAGRGVIINIADLSVYATWPHLAHHAIAKAGVVQLTHYAARELGPAIRCNAVAPGPVLHAPGLHGRANRGGQAAHLGQAPGRARRCVTDDCVLDRERLPQWSCLFCRWWGAVCLFLSGAWCVYEDPRTMQHAPIFLRSRLWILCSPPIVILNGHLDPE